MTSYGQFCPVSKAVEIVGDKWTLLILRELLSGSTRFNDFQRGLSRISPTVLNKRLKMLEDKGVIVRRRQSGLRGHEYRLTAMGRELEPIVDGLAVWGMRWARGRMTDDELDVHLPMSDVVRRIDRAGLPDGETVLRFTFSDIEHYRNWWIALDAAEADLCTEDPGKDVDLYLTSTLRTMVEVWEGDRDLRAELRGGGIVAVGPRHLVATMDAWLLRSAYAHVRPATAEERRAET